MRENKKREKKARDISDICLRGPQKRERERERERERGEEYFGRKETRGSL